MVAGRAAVECPVSLKEEEAVVILRKTVIEAMFGALQRAATQMPPDVRAALERAAAEETDPMARQHLAVSLDNADQAARGEGLVCADTGFPLFFIRAGSRTALEGGFGALASAAEEATARATAECLLRPTMVDPITRANPGNNVGPGMPRVDLRFVGDGADLEIIAAPKGGGSEIFGTFYRMLYPADGLTGVRKFVIESIRESCYAGKVCPPAIIGIGLGGTADQCMALAKRAAVLRPIGQRHPRPEIAALEEELYQASRRLGIGPMGSRGINAVLAVAIEVAVTHTAALPVAFNAQCLVGRRWRACITADQSVVYSGEVA